MQKRTKLEEKKNATEKDAARLEASLSKLQGVVQHRREHLHKLKQEATQNMLDPATNKPIPKMFKLEVEDDALQGRWMKIIEKRTIALETATTTMDLQNLQQKRIQKQYEAMLPEEKVSPKNGRNLYDTDDEASVDSDDSGI